jgi:RND family efflux transporter MFP subunit
MIFVDSLDVQGNLNAAFKAKVSARIPGPIESIFVEEGDSVTKYKTKLFQIDSLKLEKNVEIRKQELAIAKCSLREKEARLKQTSADLEKSNADLKRFRLLWESNSISADDYEKVQLKFKISEASVEHTKTLIDLSKEQLKQAELALGIAQKDLQDSTIFSPIDGKVSLKLQEPGEMAAPGKPIIVVENPESIEVSAYIPAKYYSQIKPDTTKCEISIGDSFQAEATINFKSPTINPAIRTFEIKTTLPNPKNLLIPGSLAEVRIILSQKQALGVPVNAILTRNNKRVLFVKTKSSIAKMYQVKTGIENNGWIALSPESKINEGDEIIVQGNYLLNEGMAVKAINKGEN